MAMFGQNVAEGAGISRVQVARIEVGKINTSISGVVTIARALEVNKGILFE